MGSYVKPTWWLLRQNHVFQFGPSTEKFGDPWIKKLKYEITNGPIRIG